jgi:hypothetical protein
MAGPAVERSIAVSIISKIARSKSLQHILNELKIETDFNINVNDDADGRDRLPKRATVLVQPV